MLAVRPDCPLTASIASPRVRMGTVFEAAARRPATRVWFKGARCLTRAGCSRPERRMAAAMHKVNGPDAIWSTCLFLGLPDR